MSRSFGLGALLLVLLFALLSSCLVSAKEKDCQEFNRNCQGCLKPEGTLLNKQVKCQYDLSTNECTAFTGKSTWKYSSDVCTGDNNFQLWLKSADNPHLVDSNIYSKYGEESMPPEDQMLFTVPAGHQLVVIGDVHGDFENMLRSLRLGEVIDENGNFQDNKFLVMTGDYVDRGPNSFKCLQFLLDLQARANQKTTRMILLRGNHELMLPVGSMQYLSLLEILQVYLSSEEKQWDGYFTNEIMKKLQEEKGQVVDLALEVADQVYHSTGTVFQALLKMPVLAVGTLSTGNKRKRLSFSHGEPKWNADKYAKKLNPDSFVKRFNGAVNAALLYCENALKTGQLAFFNQEKISTVKQQVQKDIGTLLQKIQEYSEFHDNNLWWFNPYAAIWREKPTRIKFVMESLYFKAEDVCQEINLQLTDSNFIEARSFFNKGTTEYIDAWISKSGVVAHVNGHNPSHTAPLSNYHIPIQKSAKGTLINVDNTISRWQEPTWTFSDFLPSWDKHNFFPWRGSPTAVEISFSGNSDIPQPKYRLCGAHNEYWTYHTEKQKKIVDQLPDGKQEQIFQALEPEQKKRIFNKFSEKKLRLVKTEGWKELKTISDALPPQEKKASVLDSFFSYNQGQAPQDGFVPFFQQSPEKLRKPIQGAFEGSPAQFETFLKASFVSWKRYNSGRCQLGQLMRNLPELWKQRQKIGAPLFERNQLSDYSSINEATRFPSDELRNRKKEKNCPSKTSYEDRNKCLGLPYPTAQLPDDDWWRVLFYIEKGSAILPQNTPHPQTSETGNSTPKITSEDQQEAPRDPVHDEPPPQTETDQSNGQSQVPPTPQGVSQEDLQNTHP